MRQFILTCRSGINRRGAIFAIDSSIAITIAIIVLAASAYFLTYTGGDPITKLNTYRTGFDLVTVMDYEGVFNRFNSGEVTNFTNKNLPASLSFRLELIVSNASNSNLTVGDGLGEAGNSSIIVGDRITVVNNENARARFYIWVK